MDKRNYFTMELCVYGLGGGGVLYWVIHYSYRIAGNHIIGRNGC